MSNIFISYRRRDTAPYAGRLCDRLSALFGSESIFMDVQDIRPGQDFTQTIQETLAKCHVLIAIIGPNWLPSLRRRGRVQDDFVEDEIVEALKRNITVIPVLVDNAKMPQPGELPTNLQALSRHQAVEIRDSRFDDDFSQLTDVLTTVPGVVMSRSSQQALGSRLTGRWKWLAVAAIVVVAAVLFLMMRPHTTELSGGWIAEMHKPGQPTYRIRLDLIVMGGMLNGTVEYPTGKAVIGDGTVAESRLTFQTVHTPPFETSPATMRFYGEVQGTTIRLTSVDSNGIATGVAERIPRSKP